MTTTYVNSLRLAEMATGDNAGTWGTTTNTNLELIAEAFGQGTENMASDANTTITMADGATDGVRSIYLKITSTTLTATREVTLAPNTVSKLWIIENATTGGRSITIKQGSGATVTIPNGSNKVVFTDGAGAGAAVFDALSDQDVDIVGGTIDGVTIGGTTTGSGAFTTLNASGATTLSAALTYGGITLSNAVTGTGNMVLSASPTMTGTIGAAAMTLSTALGVASGGTGASTLTSNNVVLGNGTSAVQFVAPGTSGNLLTSNGSTWASTSMIRAIELVIDGGGSAITTGLKAYLEVPFSCTINRVTMLADQSGSIVVDIWKDTYANYPPLVGDSICASAKPTITTATKSQDSTLTGWTTSVAAGDILAFNVDSITTCTRVTISLRATSA